jgi:hypothetical protein
VRPRWWEYLAVFVVASIGLCSVVFFYDDVHRATTNGLWKSMDVVLWTEWQPTRFTDGDNMLYYPVIGMLTRALPASVFGAVWQRMAFVNAFIGAAVMALTYLVAFGLFRSRATALFACACQFAMAFFLLLATINEDIMPGYGWFVAAVACGVAARRLTPWTIVVVAQCVALSWLFHASLRPPSVAAFVLAILAVEPTWRRRLSSVALFIVALLPVPIVSALAFGLPWWSGVWSFKGFGTTWGGFALSKIVFLGAGIGQSVWGGQNIGSIDQVLGPLAVSTVVTLLAVAALLVLWVRECWKRRAAPEWRFAAVVLTAVFFLAEGMNLYIQPQDPQMQIQPMTWFPFAAALLFWAAGRVSRGAVAMRAGLVAAVVLFFAGNLQSHTGTRHADSTAVAAMQEVEAILPPEKTMFVLQGFEGIASWLTASWGRGALWPGSSMPPPIGTRGFNAIYVGGEITLFPAHTVDEAAELVVFAIDVAFERGYDVVATDFWATSESQWVDGFATVSGPDKPLAIRAALLESFTGSPIAKIEGWGTLYRLTPKAR